MTQPQTFGPLNVRLIHPDKTPNMLVLLNHGYGAPGDDLVDLGHFYRSGDTTLREHALFAFPAAPKVLYNAPMQGRAWWDIDVARLEARARGGDVSPFFDVFPEGLKESRRALLSCLEALRASFPSLQSFVFGGFSQGAMLAADVVFRSAIEAKGLILFSGTWLGGDEWQAAAAKRDQLTLFQSHGRQDPILPFERAEMMFKRLEKSGIANVMFHPFQGAHAIPRSCLEDSLKVLGALQNDRSPNL